MNTADAVPHRELSLFPRFWRVFMSLSGGAMTQLESHPAHVYSRLDDTLFTLPSMTTYSDGVLSPRILFSKKSLAEQWQGDTRDRQISAKARRPTSGRAHGQ